MQIYISKNGKQLGPFDETELGEQIATGAVSYDDLAWAEGMSNWQPLREIATPIPGLEIPPPVPPDLIYKEGKGLPKKLLFASIVLIVIALGFLVKNRTTSNNTNIEAKKVQEEQKKAVEERNVVAKKQISSIEAATQFLVGTWTYTGPEYRCISMANQMDLQQLERLGRTITQSMIDQKRGPSNWFKYEFRPDGTFTKRTAMAISDSWSKPEDGKYTIELRKYKDTGESYYKVEVGLGSLLYFIIDPNGVLEYVSNLGEYDKARFAVPRGDINPFK